jgi:hypothetical protein
MTHEMLDVEPQPLQAWSGRLLGEWTRLYAPGRAMVLSFGRSVPWADVAAVWAGVQDEWGWPAPGIAIDGRQGYQLWFSVAAAVPAEMRRQAMGRLLQTLLPRSLPPERVQPVRDACQPWPQAQGGTVPASVPQALPAANAPADADGERWSAFVARDLAPVFEGSPWLDLSPSPEGQADLLSRLAHIEPADFEAVARPMDPPLMPAEPAEPAPSASPVGASGTPHPATDDPRAFLLRVMNDPQVSMALRIQAASALLPHVAAHKEPV